MSILVRDTSTLLKGEGVEAMLPDGSKHLLAGDNMAPPGAPYNPFFHDPKSGTMREDIPHKWPLESLAEKMAHGYKKNGFNLLDPLAHAKRIINQGHAGFNFNHHDSEHHLDKAFDEETGEMNPMYATSHASPEYQHSRMQTHERRTTTPDGQHINFWGRAAPHDTLGQFIESGAIHAYREIQEAEKANGVHSGAIRGSHIEPGHMTNGQVFRHTSNTAPGQNVPRPMQEAQNQTRQMGSADPVNIIFGDGGKPKLPAKFFETTGTGGASPKNIASKLNEHGVKDPQLINSMSKTAIGQLLMGRGASHGGKVTRLRDELAERLDIEGENADLFARIHSHIQRPTGWSGRNPKVAVQLAAMVRLADEIGDDLSDFGSWEEVAPGVVEGWQRVAPMIAQERGGSEEGHDWGAAIPEQAHQSAAVPQPPAISEGPPRYHELKPTTPYEEPSLEPQLEQRAPPRHIPPMNPPANQMAGMRPPMQSLMGQSLLRSSDDPTTRILLAMEEVQLASARQDTEIRKHLPTKRDLSVENLSDVNLVANRFNLTSNDVIALFSAGGDWERVAKAFQVAPSVVGAVKVVFS